MHVNTHSCPLRTQKLTIIHGFLTKLTLTSEGGELVNPQKTKIHNETQEICVISLRWSRGRMILNARKCWAWRREGWISEKEVKKISQIVNFLEKKTSETASLLLILPVTIQLFQNSFVSSSSSLSCTNQMTKVSSWLLFNPFSTFRCQGQSWQESMKFCQFSVLKGQLWVLTCIPAAHFSAKSANFSRGLLFLMYRNSRVHPLFICIQSTFNVLKYNHYLP